MKISTLESAEESFRLKSFESGNILKNIPLEIENNFITTEWDNWRKAFRSHILQGIGGDFLSRPEIAGTMFQNDEGITNKEIINIGFDNLSSIVEYSFSNKNFDLEGFFISTNTIHHLHHIDIFEKNKNNKEVKSILEWGGGYGNMAKVFLEKNKNIKFYTIIDIPEFITIQYIYLSSYFGDENVRIVKNNSDFLENGINLIPTSLVKEIDFVKHDLFASTWAISESTFSCQEFASERGFFDYDNLLIAYHQCGQHIPFMNESIKINDIMKDKGAKLINIDFIPGINYYAIK
jgi:hypothetical protein